MACHMSYDSRPCLSRLASAQHASLVTLCSQPSTCKFGIISQNFNITSMHDLSRIWASIEDDEMLKLTNLLEWINVQIPFGRWQLFEFNDLWIVPPFVKHDQQDAFSAHWTKRIPILQTRSPAELVANSITSTLQSLSDQDDWNVIDINSGSGGPIPVVESLVNRQRLQEGHNPIPFLLTDLSPNLDAWITLSAKSDNLSFVPQSVDAAKPAFSIISATTNGDKDAALKQGYESDGRKVLRTYCAAFHHFNDEMATGVLKSTMQTSDAFAVIELQERTFLSLALVLLEALIMYCLAVFWFWNDGTHLFSTYIMPILPVTQILDGIVTCLRTRTFEEILRLIPNGKGQEVAKVERDGSVVISNWRFKHERILHTWPLGYTNVITGTSMSHLSPEPG
ncbi:hypothetical protein CLAFUW4_00555 [Fulvia fulva]|uniref:Uncharacterized protein n=1 Tax=Passalora fulva TaxID=5499 RepID=A0A9Q8P2X3_PASFU|nr:uncharacterized protein CLAFUR5_00555 [Fulvia fulva]KAK4635074.1 hypothetical protein CLAFUR4_00556 [Fulvia fulva]KAK4638635.1 hypothetical protein CLAFUR0_00557 [Fulvia fulva]UJO11338.1 hypothetical protein CLAFUR5_00555 [Fulvia fulva]WPV08176.1 hypothetical protein CLAFUW4_00555 [Fulvia fulva]WPV24871.1 hypothetical protein CLAFUW7_00560 [Fulvia fulva]